MADTENNLLEATQLLSPVEEVLNRIVARMKELLNRTHSISDFIHSQTKEVIGNLQFCDITGQEFKERLLLRVAEICTKEKERALLYRNYFFPDRNSDKADQVDSDYSKSEVILF